jgi:hypothetical protein
MRASDYPLPDYAAYIWHRGDALGLAFVDPQGSGNTVFIPLEKFLSGKGAQWLVDTLAARHSAYVKRGKAQIGTASEPTAEMLAAALKAAPPPLYKKTNVDIFAEEDSD